MNAPSTIPGVLRAAAALWPDQPALAGPDGRDDPTTFAGLWSHARTTACSLAAHGISSGDRVAIWAPNTPAWAVAHAGILCAGATVVPVNTRYTTHEAVDLITRSGAKVAFAAEAFLGRRYASELAPPVPGAADAPAAAALPTVIPLGDSAVDTPTRVAAALTPRQHVDDRDDVDEIDRRIDRLTPDDISHIQFTSGTTGRPKGAMLRHGASVASSRTWAANTGLTHGDRYPIVAPFSHLGGHKTGLLTCLLTGATAIPVPVLDADGLASMIRSTGATFLQGPPTLFHGLVRLARADPETFTSVRVCVTGAAVVPPSLVHDLRERLGAEVFTAYGLTETTGVCTMTRSGDSIETVATTCGRPLDGVEVTTVDPDGNNVDPGRPGEVLIRGANVMAGYLDDADATAAVVRDGWMHTGDVGVLDDTGGLRIVDRLTDMVVVGGLNVYPAEIEHALIEHPGVAAAAVVGEPDDRLGEVPVAYVVATDDVVDGLGAWCAGRLAGFKIPRRFVAVDALPLNAAGKVAKRELRARRADSPVVAP